MKKLYQFLFIYFARKTPECFRDLRNYLVKKFIKSAGSNINIGRLTTIHKNTEIGNNSGIGRGCVINNGVTIGDNVMMGPDVLIYTQNHETGRTDIPMSQQGFAGIKPVVIEDGAWIGARVCILPGVTIGEGSVIGACAVVSKDVPPYSVAVGNPARVVKNRKDTEV